MSESTLKRSVNVAVSMAMLVDWVRSTYPQADSDGMADAIRATVADTVDITYRGDPLLDGYELLIGLDAALRFARNQPDPA